MSTAVQKRKAGAVNRPKSDRSRAGVSSSRLVRHRLGRVEIDRAVFMVEIHPCLAIAAQLAAGGFPLNLGIMGPELWSDEQWKWGKFREAAAKVGATWWSWNEDVGARSYIFEWGSMANVKTVATCATGDTNGGNDA